MCTMHVHLFTLGKGRGSREDPARPAPTICGPCERPPGSCDCRLQDFGVEHGFQVLGLCAGAHGVGP